MSGVQRSVMIRQIAGRVIAAVRAAVHVHYNIRARYQSLYSRMATMRHAPSSFTDQVYRKPKPGHNGYQARRRVRAA